MAFQQSARQPAQRVFARPAAAQGPDAPMQATVALDRQHDDSQTWVLFSPVTDVTTTSFLSETDHLAPTSRRSSTSEIERLHRTPRARSFEDIRTILTSTADDASVEDDAELDSLDSHLPEFRSLPGVPMLSELASQHVLPVLPTHDGFGSFRLDIPFASAEAQEQIFKFERYNPRRVRRRLDSLDHAQPEPRLGDIREEEKRLRIEAWRMEHSRVLLDEVQRETRRRCKSQASLLRGQHGQHSCIIDSDSLSWHDEEANLPENASDSILVRVARKIAKEILGIDDTLLSILLGGALSTDSALSDTSSGLRADKKPSLVLKNAPFRHLRILECLSKELDSLVHYRTHHPGASSIYGHLHHPVALPYAGLPVIPEDEEASQATGQVRPNRHKPLQMPQFQPSMNPHLLPQRGGDAQVDSAGDELLEDTNTTSAGFTKDEWERRLDVKLVFRYLVSRFTQPKGPSAAGDQGQGSTSTSQEGAARLSRVRQHHPLVARSRRPPPELRIFRGALPGSPVAVHHHSSRASQSTRRSARRSSCSSRHYWDIGTSLGTGSMIGPHGPMGSWGEV